MKALIYSLTISLLLLSSLEVIAQKYTLEDLKILHKQKSYIEYLDHALDVLPTKRTKEWDEMTGEMALHFIEIKLKDSIITADTFRKVEKLNHIPILKENSFFQLKRSQLAKKYFNNCSLKKAACFDQFKSFWAKSTKYPNISYDIYKKYQYIKNVVALTLPHFTQSSGASLYCSDKKILDDILAINNNININTYISNIYKMTHGDCLDSLTPLLKEHYLYKENAYYNEIAYELLKKSKKLSQYEEDLFFALYILNGPEVGKIFNFAWNRINSLSQDYKRRIKLLEGLSKRVPLPDNVFSHPDKKKREVIVKLFAKNFPEYISYYAKTCSQFFAGEKNFKFGNPTPHCDDLMKISRDKNWVSDKIKMKYSSSKKLQ